MSKRGFGFDQLCWQITESVCNRINGIAVGVEHSPYSIGDTPIERLLIFAVWSHTQFCESANNWQSEMCRNDSELLESKEGPYYRELLLCQPQAQIKGVGRVDFLFHAYATWERKINPRPECWRSLIVECDGHNFHERTKEQASKDKARDRAAQLAGYEVFRFTGSEIWRDPLGCAQQIIDWADAGI